MWEIRLKGCARTQGLSAAGLWDLPFKRGGNNVTHFRILNDEYRNEHLSADDTDRRRALEGLANNLAKAMKKMNDLRPQRPPISPTKKRTPSVAPHAPKVHTGASTVKDLKAFHTQQQSSSTAADVWAKKIVHLRQWLFRQGVKLTPDGKIVWRLSNARVLYDEDPEAQAMTRLTIQNGQIFGADGELFDTSRMVTMHSGPNWAIYVMSAENIIHASSHAVGKRHHSSLLAGGPVACAGEIQVEQGRLLVLTNKSGHYTPPPAYLSQVISVLDAGGVEPDSYKVLEHGPPPNKTVTHPSAAAFMALQRIPNWPDDDANAAGAPYRPAAAPTYADPDSDSDSDDYADNYADSDSDDDSGTGYVGADPDSQSSVNAAKAFEDVYGTGYP